MKVLYANPVFWDYRLPFYKRLNDLFKGNFHILYSPKRYKLFGRPYLINKIRDTMGENAHPFYGEYIFDTHTKSFNKSDIERGKKIPIVFGLLRSIRKIRPDVIITEGFFQWTPWVIFYSILHNIPVYVGYERTMYTERNNPWFINLHRRLSNFFITGYFVNGEETKKYLLSLGINESKIHLGGMSADSEGLIKGIRSFDIKEKDNLKFLYNKGYGLIYLFVDQIVKRKGVGYLLKAWRSHIKHYVDDTLILLGDGVLLSDYKKQYADLNSIHFEGRIKYDTVYKYYAIADVAIMPTIEDNWSLVIPEAMACGLPVATSIYNGCHSELIKEGVNGTIFDTFDNSSLIKALDFFHHQNLKKMGEKSIQLEKPFNIENSTRRIYETLLQEQSIKK